MKRPIWVLGLCGLMVVLARPADAQLNGSHSLGDFGVQSGSQPQPGFYTALFYFRYDTDTIKDKDGDIIRPAPNSPGSIGLTAVAPILWETGARIKTQGQTLAVTATFPIPSVRLS